MRRNSSRYQRRGQGGWTASRAGREARARQAGGLSRILRRFALAALLIGVMLGFYFNLSETGAYWRPQLRFLSDSRFHFVGFILFGVAAYAAAPPRLRGLALFGLFAFGLSLEVRQNLLTVSRSASWKDYFFNSTGACVGYAVTDAVMRLRMLAARAPSPSSAENTH